MAIYRQIQTTYWQDKFILTLTPEEKFFYIYLLTNSKTKQCGIYELPIKIIEVETGYNRETVLKLLNRFIDHKKIMYDWENEEIALKNWLKHNNYENNPKIQKCVEKELTNVKNETFFEFMGFPDTPCIGYHNKNKNNNNNKNKENNNHIDIHKLWISTFGRNPKLPEVEVTEDLITKFGYNKVYQIFKQATLDGFNKIKTLVNSLDEQGNIKPKPKIEWNKNTGVETIDHI